MKVGHRQANYPDAPPQKRRGVFSELSVTAGTSRLGAALRRLRDRLRAEWTALRYCRRYAPAGHFYSPIASLKDIRSDESRIFGAVPRNIPGIDLREEEQLRLLAELAGFYPEVPFRPDRTDGLRYCFENLMYSYSDAILLYGMIRHLRPKRIIEIGSGFSSCVTLDTNELHFGGAVQTTFIEPHPGLLLSLIKPSDRDRIRLIPTRLQEVDLSEFDVLGSNDILFVDSTHVSKVDSDVNRIVFEILPRLAAGVYIHFHDVFFPFEYPRDWILEGRAWTEAYLLRCFLQYNSAFRIVLMSDFLHRFHHDFFRENMPLCRKNTGGSLWISRQGSPA